jgi:hypothetical protein
MARKLLLLLFVAGCRAWEPRYETVAPPSNYARAEDAMQRGQVDLAIPLLETYLRETADPTYRPRAYFQLARAYYSLGQHRKTLTILDEMEREFPEELWPQTAALRGDTEYALGNRTTGFLAWETAWQRGGPFDQAALRDRMGRAVRELTPDEIRELRQMVTVEEIQKMLQGGPTAWNTEAQEPPRVKELPSTSEYAAAPPSDREISRTGSVESAGVAEQGAAVIDSAETAAGAPSFSPNAPRLGALLALTGAERHTGQQALKGLRLAGAGTSSPLELRDTGSDPNLAAQLFSSIASDPRVLAVIAPLRHEEAAAVAPLADRFSVPLLLPPDYTGPGGRFALKATAEPMEQITALVTYVFDTLHLKRFGILYPSDDRGHARMEQFQNEALKHGATLVGIKGYTPGKGEFVSEIASVLRWETEGGLEALYIADTARATMALGTALHVRAPRLILLGALDAGDRDLVARSAPDLEGAIFASNDVGAAARPGTSVESHAFEAARLGRQAIESGARSREQILAQLRQIGRFGGLEQLFRVRQGRLESVGNVPTQS